MSSSWLVGAEYTPNVTQTNEDLQDGSLSQSSSTTTTAQTFFQESTRLGAVLQRLRRIILLYAPQTSPLNARHNPPTPMDLQDAASSTKQLVTQLDELAANKDALVQAVTSDLLMTVPSEPKAFGSDLTKKSTLGTLDTANAITTDKQGTAPTADVADVQRTRVTGLQKGLQSASDTLRQMLPSMRRLARHATETSTYRKGDKDNLVTSLRRVYNNLTTLVLSETPSTAGGDDTSRDDLSTSAAAAVAVASPSKDMDIPVVRDWSTGLILNMLSTHALWLDVNETAPVSEDRTNQLLRIGTDVVGMRMHVVSRLSLDQRATQPLVEQLNRIANKLDARTTTEGLLPIELRQIAYQLRSVRDTMASYVSAGVVLNDNALQQASARANADLVRQWKRATPDILDVPLRVLLTNASSSWATVVAELTSDKVWGCFTNPTDPDYAADSFVKVFVVLRRMGLVVADGSGERAMHIGLGILLVGLVATLLGAVMFR